MTFETSCDKCGGINGCRSNCDNGTVYQETLRKLEAVKAEQEAQPTDAEFLSPSDAIDYLEKELGMSLNDTVAALTANRMDSNEPEAIDTVTVTIPRKTYEEMVAALKGARELARHSPFNDDGKAQYHFEQVLAMVGAEG